MNANFNFEELQEKWGDLLMERVVKGDCAEARRFFDVAFWGGVAHAFKPEWQHLKAALLREDKDMIRLLVTWGAEATDADMQGFRVTAKGRYQNCVKLLRTCGVKLSAEAMSDRPWGEPAEADMLGKVPAEWLRVLDTAKKFGADEAVIAGGALRDLFNDRAIRDVDIFLKSRGSKSKDSDFLERVFNSVGYKMEPPERFDGYQREEFPYSIPFDIRLMYADNYDAVLSKGSTHSFAVVAGPQKTEFNIVFVRNMKFAKLPVSGKKTDSNSISHDYFKWSLIQAFDFGICQIACDGKEVVMTSAYKKDVAQSSITLSRANDDSKWHLERLKEKYPTWELSADAKALLLPPPRPRFGGSCNTGPR